DLGLNGKKEKGKLKKSALYAPFGTAQMPIGQIGGLPAPGGPHDKSLLDQKGLIDLFQGLGAFGYRRGQGTDPHRAALELVDDREQDLVVHLIQAVGIHVQGFEPKSGDSQVNVPTSFDLGKVPDPSQQGIAYPGGAPAPAGDLQGRLLGDGDP